MIVMMVLAGLAGVIAGASAVGLLAGWMTKLDYRVWRASADELEEKLLDAQADVKRLREENISLLEEKLRL